MNKEKTNNNDKVNLHNLIELKRIIIKGMVADEKFFKYGDGFKVFEQMDKHIVGVS